MPVSGFTPGGGGGGKPPPKQPPKPYDPLSSIQAPKPPPGIDIPGYTPTPDYTPPAPPPGTNIPGYTPTPGYSPPAPQTPQPPAPPSDSPHHYADAPVFTPETEKHREEIRRQNRERDKQQNNMLNQDFNYVVAGRGRPKSAGRIDTVQEITDTVEEYLDIYFQFEELLANDRISRELFESYEETLLDDRIQGFFDQDDDVENFRPIIDWSQRDITNMTFAEVQQLVDSHLPLYRDKSLFDLVGRTPQNSSLAELEKVADDGRILNWLYPLLRATQAAEIMLEEGPEFFTEVGDAFASRGPEEAMGSLSRGDLGGAIGWGVGHVAFVNTDAHHWIAGMLAVGDGVADVGQSILYGETHEVNPIARAGRGGYQLLRAWLSRKVGSRLSRGLRPTMGRLTGKLGAGVLSHPVFHRPLSTLQIPILQNSDSTLLDMLSGALSDGFSGIFIDQVVENIVPSPAEVERYLDDTLDNIPRPPDDADIGMNHPQSEMPDVNSILEAQPWVDSAEYYVTQREYCFAMELYNEALSIYPDLKGEIDQPGTYYQEAINNCQG